MLTRSQTGDMDLKQGENEAAYEGRMLTLMAEIKQRTDVATTARKKKEEEAEHQHQLAEEQRRQHNEAAARAANEEPGQWCEKVFKAERDLLKLAEECRTKAESGDITNSGLKISCLLSRFTDLLATCIAQREDIQCLNDAVDDHKKTVQQLTSPIQLLELPFAAPKDGPSSLSTRLNEIEVVIGTLKEGTQQLSQQICTATAAPPSTSRDRIPKFDGIPIFCNASKTEPVPWWRRFDLVLDMYELSDPKRHAYGGVCQAWLDNLLSTHKVTVSELHKQIRWADLKAAWHKRFQVEPPDAKFPSEHPAKERGRGKSKTNTSSNHAPGTAAQEPWIHYSLSEGIYKIRTRFNIVCGATMAFMKQPAIPQKPRESPIQESEHRQE
ncbi:hypothetical protein CBR_g32660 [Chara braunii]|uniref:Uncharacterized protein n=1 Tax=Chara braunii TaxID=69332 RepID=A0A388LHE0_CHABU|nr:hypothetical protein CBR_g32660 [Chara braunii]|eukprot:GBG81665.1 hypothetical protein CBR_g32660 [Chara braunii]